MLFRGFWEKLVRPIIGLAPMDGVTDAAFRYMVCSCSGDDVDGDDDCEGCGSGVVAGHRPSVINDDDCKLVDESRSSVTNDWRKPSVVITEFTNVEGLARGNVKGLVAFLYSEIERPVVAQIFGVEPESYYKAAVLLCAMGFDGIDINMGCPVSKVAAKGSGAALIKTPELAKKLVMMTQKGVKDWVDGISLEEAGVHEGMIEVVKRLRRGSDERQSVSKEKNAFPGTGLQSGKSSVKVRRPIPVSIKTRIGYDEIVAEEWVKHLLEVQPANITMHGRTLKQLYTGQANWEVLAKAARVVHQSGLGISFLGNGDVKSMDDAREKIAEYGVDGVLVGRAVLGNPWFFADRRPGVTECLNAAIEHAKYFEKLNHIAFQNVRKHLGWYCRGFEGAKELRMRLMKAENAGEVEDEIRRHQGIKDEVNESGESKGSGKIT